jgi:hypothetical protein
MEFFNNNNNNNLATPWKFCLFVTFRLFLEVLVFFVFILLRVALLLGRTLTIFDSLEGDIVTIESLGPRCQLNGSLKGVRGLYLLFFFFFGS